MKMVEISSFTNIVQVINYFVTFLIPQYLHMFLEKYYLYIIAFLVVTIVFYVINRSRFRSFISKDQFLRTISFMVCLISFIWLIYEVHFTKEMGFEPIVSLLCGFSGLIGSYVSFEASDKDSTRYCKTLLKQTKNIWIKGFLEKSLKIESLIELGLEERNSEIKCPLNKVLQTPSKPNRKLPQGTKIIDIFDENIHPLLILGEPGSGKTTMLLELACELIARAEKDSNEATPVVFNLASWENKSISDWLVDELITMYSVPSKIARVLVENDKLLLLLDGLDEVSSNYREDCVKEINRFSKDHLVPIVICSRLKDYEILNERLEVQSAVLLQPLTKDQVFNYLSLFDKKVDTLRMMIQNDMTYQELSQTPLMLNIMILAYSGKLVEEIQSSGTFKEHKKHLFDCYVKKMFKRRSPKQPYSPKQTIHWLSWIARNMSKSSKSIFLIDKIQMNWLSDYKIFIPSCLEEWNDFQEERQNPSKISQLSEKLPLIVAIAIGIISGLIGLLVGGLSLFLYLGIIGIYKGYSERIELVEKLDFTLNEDPFDVFFSFLSLGMCYGFFIMPVFLLFHPLRDNLIFSTDKPLFIPELMFFAIVFVVYFFETFLFLLWTQEADFKVVRGKMVIPILPNEGINQSLKSSIVSLAIYGSLGGLVGGLYIPLVGSEYLIYSIPVGSSILGLIFGLENGGRSCIQHFALRIILWRKGFLPLKSSRFLNYAVERVFLRKVGGGYIFIHRELMDYFASLNENLDC